MFRYSETYNDSQQGYSWPLKFHAGASMLGRARVPDIHYTKWKSTIGVFGAMPRDAVFIGHSSYSDNTAKFNDDV